MNKTPMFAGIPNLYGEVEFDPIKAFFVTKEFAYTALVFAAMDRNDVREGILNPLDGPSNDGFFLKKGGRQFAHDAAVGNNSAILEASVPINEQDVVLVDIVTYPFWHCLISDLNPFTEGNDSLLWKVNHNILAPFAELICACGYPYTFIHLNEEPIDDAPTHNIIVFDKRDFASKARVNAVQNLFKGIPNSNLVSKENPFMDDRYCLNERRASDPVCEQAPIFLRDEMIISK